MCIHEHTTHRGHFLSLVGYVVSCCCCCCVSSNWGDYNHNNMKHSFFETHAFLSYTYTTTDHEVNIKHLWYTSSECMVFQRNCMEEARRIVQLEQDAKMDFNSYRNVLECLQDVCCNLRAKSNSSSSSVEEGLIISHDEFWALQNMLSTNYDCVGMEQSTVCNLFSDRLVWHK